VSSERRSHQIDLRQTTEQENRDEDEKKSQKEFKRNFEQMNNKVS